MPPWLQIQRRPVDRSVALPDRVGGDQAECALGPYQVERPAEEIGHEICIPLSSRFALLKGGD